MKKQWICLALVLCMLLSLAACGRKESPVEDTKASAGTAPESAAETETVPETEAQEPVTGEVNVYMAATEDFAIAIKEKFEAANPGITMNYVLLGGGEILTRLRAEAENPQADCVVGGSCDGLMLAKSEDLLASYQSPNIADWDPTFYDPDGYWTGYIRGFLGFYCDQAWFADHDMELPTSWYDLLDERLVDNVIVTNPGTSSTGFMLLSTICQLLGEEEGMEYMAKLDKNVKQYAKGGSGPSNSVALGEAALGVGYIQFGVQLAEQGYSDLVIRMPEEGTAQEIASMAIVKNCKNEDAAKCLIDYLASVEGQEIMNDCQLDMYPCNPHATTTDRALAYADSKTIDLDFAWSSANRDRLIEAWDAMTANQ